MTEDNINVGIIGVGNIGNVHLQSAQRIPGASVSAVADIQPSRRAQARRLGVDVAYSDYHDLLSNEPLDAVVVSLPPTLHADAVRTAVGHGCHAFIEKPFAPTLSEAKEMVSAADSAGVYLGVDHTIRYQTEIQELKADYDSGELGHVPIAFISRVNNGPFSPPPADNDISTWQIEPGGGYGAVLDLGVHLFDVLEWFFGEMEIQHAMMDRQLNLPYEDTTSIQLEGVESGTMATLNCGFFQWEVPPDINMRFRLEGVTKSISSEQYVPRNFTTYAARSVIENVGNRLRGLPLEYFKPTFYYQAHYRALRDFLTAIRHGNRPPVNGEHGRRTIELAEEAYRLSDFDRETTSDEPSFEFSEDS